MNIKEEIIEHLREDNLDVSLELEIVKNRLQAVDPVYQNYRVTFDRLIQFINDNSISLVAYFKKFDRDGSGKLSKN